MNIERRTVGEALVLSIVGDITLDRAGGVRLADKVRSALEQGHDRLVLDLGRVRYVDSVGLGELVQALSAVRNRGGAMRLLNVTKRLNDLFVVNRLLTVFDCFDQESEALASFGPQLAPLGNDQD
jgi:anti-sigma B factor antagonist